MDERGKAFFSTFMATANLFSYLYELGQDQQRQVFQDAEQHSLGNLLNWILDKGPQVTVDDVITYIKEKIYYGGIYPMVLASQYQHPPTDVPGPHNLMMPYEMLAVSAPSYFEGNLEQHYTTSYHGESSRANQLGGNDQGNDMETESYISEEHTQHLNQSAVNNEQSCKFHLSKKANEE